MRRDETYMKRWGRNSGGRILNKERSGVTRAGEEVQKLEMVDVRIELAIR